MSYRKINVRPMKKILIPFILIPALSFGQKLAVNEIDKFNKAHKLQTSNVRLKNGMLCYIRTFTSSLDIKLDTTFYYITFFGTLPAPDVIGTDDRLIFLLENDSTITIYSTGIQGSEYRSGVRMYNHQYKAQGTDIVTLSKENVKSIRKYGTRGYVDLDIPKKNQDEFKSAASLIVNELKK
jgi:hypothetical protein